MKWALLVLSMIGAVTEEEAQRPYYYDQVQGNAEWQREVQELDRMIKKMTNRRNLELAKATQAQNQGDRLQFQSNELMDARRAWARADTHKEIAERLDQEIAKLEAKKAQILAEHGITPPS